MWTRIRCRACFRVWSIVAKDVVVIPAAPPSTAKRLTPFSVRPATRTRLALWPSITNILWPSSFHSAPWRVAASVIPSMSQRPLSSVSARVATVSPEAIPGSRSFLAASSPLDRSALAARATVEK